jgi:hypothetical protein
VKERVELVEFVNFKVDVPQTTVPEVTENVKPVMTCVALPKEIVPAVALRIPVVMTKLTAASVPDAIVNVLDVPTVKSEPRV